jgi:tetratricopeptide (TPR) repeat protein
MDPLCISRQVQIVDKSYREKTIAPIVFFLLTSVLISSTTLAQDIEKLDSLKSVAHSARGINKWEPLYEIGFQYIDYDQFSSALPFIEESLSVGLAYGDTLKIAKSTRVKAYILGQLGHVNRQIELLEWVLNVMDRNKLVTEYLIACNTLGNAYIFKGRFDLALKYHLKCLDLKRFLKLNDQLSSTEQNVGMVYYKLNNYDRAIDYFLQALEREKSVGQKNFSISTAILLNLSLCYAYKKEFSVAKKYINDALNICDVDCFSRNQIEFSFNEGLIYYSIGDLRKAEVLFKKSYDYSLRQGNVRFLVDNASYLSSIYIKKMEFDIAEAYLVTAESHIDEKIYNSEKLRLYSRFIELYSARGDLQNEVTYRNKYIQLDEANYDFSFTTNLVDVQNEHIDNNYDRIHSNQKRLLVIKENVYAKEKIVTFFIAMIFVLVIICLWVIYRNNKRVKSFNLLLLNRVHQRRTYLHSRNLFLSNLREGQQAEISKLLLKSQDAIEGLKSDIELNISQRVGEQFDPDVNVLSGSVESVKQSVENFSHQFNSLSANARDRILDNGTKRKLAIIVTMLILTNSTDVLSANRQNGESDTLRASFGHFENTNADSFIEPCFLQHFNNASLLARLFSNNFVKGNEATLVNGILVKCLILRKRGLYKEEISVLTAVLPIVRKDKHCLEYKLVLQELAGAYFLIGKLGEALEYQLELLHNGHDTSNWFDVATALENIGIIYYKLRDFKKAISFTEQSLRLKQDLGAFNNPSISNTKLNLCLFLLTDDRINEAVNELQYLLSNDEKLFDAKNELKLQVVLGIYYLKLNDLLRAKKYLMRSWSIAGDQEDYLVFDAVGTTYLVDMFIKEGSYDSAYHVLSLSLEKYRAEHLAAERIQLYHHIIPLLVKMDRIKEARFYQKELMGLKELMYALPFVSKVMDVEGAYKVRKHEQLVASERAIIFFNEQRATLQYHANMLLTVLILILCFLLLLLLRVYKQTKNFKVGLNVQVVAATKDLEEANSFLLHESEQRQLILERGIHRINNALSSVTAVCDVMRQKSNTNESVMLSNIHNSATQLLSSWSDLKEQVHTNRYRL